MLFEDLFRFRIGAVENFFDLVIDFLSGAFAAIALEGPVGPRQVKPIISLSAPGQSYSFAHSEKANHLAGKRGRMFEIVFRAGSHLVENNFLGCASTEHAADSIQEL